MTGAPALNTRKQALVAMLGLCVLAAVVTLWMVRSSGRDRLRQIVQEQCLAHWLKSKDPEPCVRLSGRASTAAGYAVLADRKGGVHFLLIPTATVSGIESPALRAPGALNYFAAAWEATDVLSLRLGHAVPREAVALAVNHRRARSQDQLHIHMSCLRPAVYETLKGQSDRIGPSWSALTIGSSEYQAMRVMGAELGAANPFELLADRLPDARANMAEYTLLVAGMDYKDGPGFVVLAGRAVPGAELLLDSSCAVAG